MFRHITRDSIHFFCVMDLTFIWTGKSVLIGTGFKLFKEGLFNTLLIRNTYHISSAKFRVRVRVRVFFASEEQRQRSFVDRGKCHFTDFFTRRDSELQRLKSSLQELETFYQEKRG